jgi:hypothetical protein
VRTKDHELRNTESPVFTLAFDSVRNRSFADTPKRYCCRADRLQQPFGSTRPRIWRKPGTLRPQYDVGIFPQMSANQGTPAYALLSRESRAVGMIAPPATGAGCATGDLRVSCQPGWRDLPSCAGGPGAALYPLTRQSRSSWLAHDVAESPDDGRTVVDREPPVEGVAAKCSM